MSEDTAPPTLQPAPGAAPAGSPPSGSPPGGFWQRRGADVGLGLLAVYVVLLAIGTAAELFDIQWILDLPIY